MILLVANILYFLTVLDIHNILTILCRSTTINNVINNGLNALLPQYYIMFTGSQIF